MMNRKLLTAMAILDGQNGSFAYCSEDGKWNFRLSKKCFPQMQKQEGGYVIDKPDALPMLTNNAPVLAIKFVDKPLKVYTKSDFYNLANNLLSKANDTPNLPCYRVDQGALSFLAIRILTMSTSVKPEDMAKILFSEWCNYPTDYQELIIK